MTRIGATMSLTAENCVHCTGTMVSRSLLASATIRVSADWLCSASLGGRKAVLLEQRAQLLVGLERHRGGRPFGADQVLQRARAGERMPYAAENDARVVEQVFLNQLGGGRSLVLRTHVEIDAAVLQPGLERRVQGLDQVQLRPADSVRGTASARPAAARYVPPAKARRRRVPRVPP